MNIDLSKAITVDKEKIYSFNTGDIVEFSGVEGIWQITKLNNAYMTIQSVYHSAKHVINRSELETAKVVVK